MKLNFVSPHLSIKIAESFELPALTILTGLNGAGKTHLLEAISNGAIIVEGVPLDQIRIYRVLDFKLKAGELLRGAQIQAQAKQAWSRWAKGRSDDPQKQAQKIFEALRVAPTEQEKFDAVISENRLWNHALNVDESISTDLRTEIYTYQSKIMGLLSGGGMKPYKMAFSNVLYKLGKPAHLITNSEFEHYYYPANDTEDYLSNSLSAVFTKYRIRQFLYAHEQWENSGEKHSVQDLYRNFERLHPKPWEIINRVIRDVEEAGGGVGNFSFEVLGPDGEDDLRIDTYQEYKFEASLIDCESGETRAFGSLSSGEQVILALVVSVFQSNDQFALPRLVLLDEVDSSLHPSMIKSLFYALSAAFIEKGISVILATHSPSTIALADEESLFVVQKGDVVPKVTKVSRPEAISAATEGFFTLDDGAKIVGSLKAETLNIISEGHNSKIIKHLLGLHGVHNVQIVEGIEAISGTGQLKSIFDFLKVVQSTGRVLFVLDCDCKTKFENTSNVRAYTIPENTQNRLAKRGIENAFPEAVFPEELITRVFEGETEKSRHFSGDKKRAFLDHILKQSDIALFQHFDELVEVIRQLASWSTETD